MKVEIVLYILIFNKETISYDILSEHPEKFEECKIEAKLDSNIDTQVDNLYYKYLDLSTEYIRFIYQKPIVTNNSIKLPFYCLVPYHDFNIKNAYRVPCAEYAKFIPNLRKIINSI